METISVSELKAKLSEQLRKVEAGATIIVLDHKRPVARLAPLEDGAGNFFAKPATRPCVYRPLEPLSDFDPLPWLLEDREDRT